MIDMETSKPLDKALNFNPENIFEYIELLLSQVNADTIGDQANETVKTLCEYITSLPIPSTEDVIFKVEDMAYKALSQTSSFAFKAGFMEACRLMQTLRSF